MQKNMPEPLNRRLIDYDYGKIMIVETIQNLQGKDSMRDDLGKILMSGSVRNSSSWLLQLAAARPKLEKAPPRKTSVILI